jgi:hypothetical protein
VSVHPSVRVCLTAASLLLPLASAYAGTLTVTAQAGVGGLGRTGRWTPVHVSVDNTDRDVTGDLVVSWGDAVVRRAITIGHPARANVVLYIRTADVRDLVSVRVESNGTALQSLEVPIRLQPPDDDVTLCVGVANVPAPSGICAATVTAAALPRSMWGYDAVDHLRWNGVGQDVLDREQRTALDRWMAKRALDDAGVTSLEPRSLAVAAVDASTGPARLAVLGMVVYLGVLVVIAVAVRHLRRRPFAVYAAVAACAVLASAAALAAGRAGPSSAIVVTQSSRVEQLPAGGSRVVMKASAQYPTYDTFRIRARLTEAAIEPDREGSRSEFRFAESGEPELAGTFGLASREAFGLEGVVAFAPFRLSRRDATVTVANASAFDYRDCVFSDGLAREPVGALRAGQAIDAPSAYASSGFISCTLAATPVDFAESRYPVDVQGSTDVVAHLGPLLAAGAR